MLRNGHFVSESLAKSEEMGGSMSHVEKMKLRKRLEYKAFQVSGSADGKTVRINDNFKYGWVNRSFLKAALFYCQNILNDM